MTHRVYLPRSQKKGYNCGPTAVANAMAIYGIPTTPEEAHGACAAGKQGTDEDEVGTMLRFYGFDPVIYREGDKRRSGAATLKWVKQRTDYGRLVIASINGHGDNGHWILILGVITDYRQGTFVHVWDPNDDRSKLVPTNNLFDAWWNVESDDEDGYEPAGVILVAMAPRKRLAKQAVRIRRNLQSPPFGQLPTKK